jgi:serine/threonine protein kinase/tetratricopeptide (TPR) repeat protein
MTEAITDELFARAIVDAKVATFEQVLAARHTQALSLKAGIILPLPDALINDGVITLAQRDQLLRSLKTQSGLRQLGKYKLIKQLGRGAMGVVFLAEDTLAGRRVAMKILPKKLAENRDFIGRFQREAKATGKLNHVNIIGAFDAGQDHGHYYYVMEYCDGKPLSQLLEHSKFLPWEKAVDIVAQVAQGLQHAHQNSVLHRDIKPENIFVTNDGTAKILDLGLSKDTESEDSFRTQSGNTVGTPHYISPEQARGDKPVDGRADIYSLGATFYHLLTGQYPFNGPTAASVMLKHLTDSMPNPQLIQESVPDSVVAILERMTEKDPADRYPSCDELITDLTAVMCGKQPSAAAITSAKSKSAVRSAGTAGSRMKTPAVQHSIRRSAPQRLLASSSQHLIGLLTIAGLIVIGCVLAAMWSSSNSTIADGGKLKSKTDTASAISTATATATDSTRVTSLSIATFPTLPGVSPTTVPSAPTATSPFGPPPSHTDNAFVAADARERRAQDAYDALEKRLATLSTTAQKVEALDCFNTEFAESLAGARARALKARLLAPPAPTATTIDLSKPEPVSVTAKSREDMEALNLLIKHAQQLGEQRDFAGSAAELGKAMQIDPNQPVLYHNRSAMHFELGDFKNALTDIDRSIALGAKSWQTWALRAILCYGMHREDEFHASVDKAAGMASKTAKQIEEHLARDCQRARVVFDGKALESKTPETAADFLARGQFRLTKGNTTDGTADLKEALKRDPSLGPKGLLGQLGNLAHQAKNYRESLNYFKQWAEAKPEVPEGYNAYAWELLTCEDVSLRDPKLGLQFAEKASSLTNNSNPMILDTLALAYFNNGRTPMAVTTEEKALALLPSGAPAEMRKEYEEHARQFRSAH